MKRGSKAEARGQCIADNLVPAAKMKGEDETDTEILHSMSEEACRYISSFSWCGSVLDAYFGGGVGGIFAVFFVHIRPARSGVSPWIWVMVGDFPPAYLPLDDCQSPAEAFDLYIEGMRRWVEYAREGGKEPAPEDVPPVNVPSTKEWSEKLGQRLDALTTVVKPFFEESSQRPPVVS